MSTVIILTLTILKYFLFVVLFPLLLSLFVLSCFQDEA